MKNILSNTGHALAALGISALGIGLAATQSGIISGNGALAIVAIGVLYQAFTGKAITVAPAVEQAVQTVAAAVPTPIPPVAAPIPAVTAAPAASIAPVAVTH